MFKSVPLLIILLIQCANLFAQTKVGEFESAPGFSRGNQAAGYFLKQNTSYQINLQIGDKISRALYDSSFHQIGNYENITQEYTFNKDFISTPIFIKDLQLEKNNYEIYVDKKRVLLITPDFINKKDSVIYSMNLKDHERGEKRIAVMPFSKGLRVLSFSNQQDKLYLYEWQENNKVDTIEFSLPASTLSDEEVKKYSKYAKIKYKTAFDQMIVCEANTSSVVGLAGSNYVYYTEDKIWLVSQTPYYTGFNILEINIKDVTLSTSNYFINDMRKNVDAKSELKKKPYALIYQDYLVLRNSSNYLLEYYFYNLKNHELLKKYSVSNEDSLDYLIHSDFNQRGTWLSGGGEKKLDNEKAYLRKLSSGDGFIILSNFNSDSITLTTGSLKTIEGLVGSLVSIGTAFFSYAANFTIGSFQIIPYLQIYRNKLVYSHSRFSNNSFEPSTSHKITTTIDKLLDSFEKRDLKSTSTILILKEDEYYIAVFNPDNKKLELFKLLND